MMTLCTTHPTMKTFTRKVNKFPPKDGKKNVLLHISVISVKEMEMWFSPKDSTFIAEFRK